MEILKKYWYWALVPVILGVMFITMFYSSKGDSAIVDEIAHIPSGYSYITTGDYRLNPEHPPLIKDLAAVPLLFLNLKFPYDYWKANLPVINNQWQMGWKFIYETAGNDPSKILEAAHIPMMLLSLTLGLLVFIWAKKLFGVKAGLFALVLYAFDASIIAHSRFVTTDLGISFALFLNLFSLFYFLEKPTKKRMFLTAVTFFIALVTKFSVAILGPVYIIIFLMLLARKGTQKETTLLTGIFDQKLTKRFISALVSFAIICLSGVVMMWGFYFFHTMNMPAEVQRALIHESIPGNSVVADTLAGMSGNQVTKPLAQWLLGFSMVAGHVEGGHDAFLLGMTSNKGWWYYYPVVLALKTAIPIFFFLAFLFIFRKKLQWNGWFTEIYLWVLPLVLLVMGMQGSINLGIRYMLPIFPFIFVAVARLTGLIDFTAIKNGLKDWKALSVALLIPVLTVWYVLGSLSAYPHYLSYFNEFVGGYQNGYKYLTDSNLDWGQDVKRLSEWIKTSDMSKEHKCQYQTYVDVFPGSMPAAYYIGRDRMIEWHVQNGKPTGCFAISATFYQNSKMKKEANGGMDYAWLDSEKPITNIGGSILIYDLKKQ